MKKMNLPTLVLTHIPRPVVLLCRYVNVLRTSGSQILETNMFETQRTPWAPVLWKRKIKETVGALYFKKIII
jgi:hypothetical protein